MEIVSDSMVQDFEYRSGTLSSMKVDELIATCKLYNLQLPEKKALKKVYMRILYDHLNTATDSDEESTKEEAVAVLSTEIERLKGIIAKRELRIEYLNIFTPKDLFQKPLVYIIMY